MMTNKYEKMSLIELKAAVYDLLAEQQRVNIELRVVNELVQNKEVEKIQEVKKEQ